MLYSVIVGNQTKVNNNWELKRDTKSQFESFYIGNESIFQRIRIGNKVKENLELAYSDANSAGYRIPKNIWVSHNNKNMNLSIMNFWPKDNESRENHIDDSLIYLTMITENYTLLGYEVSSNKSIMCTYRKRGLYQGCVIKYSGENVSDDLITLYVKDNASNRFVEINIDIIKVSEDSDELRITVNKKEIEDKRTISKLRANLKKFGDKFHFKVDVYDETLLTSVYFVNPKYIETFPSLLKHIPNADCIAIDPIAFESDKLSEEDKKEVESILEEHIKKKRIRAITTVGVKLPYTFCRDYSILYLFDYDPEENKLTCLKSN